MASDAADGAALLAGDDAEAAAGPRGSGAQEPGRRLGVRQRPAACAAALALALAAAAAAVALTGNRRRPTSVPWNAGRSTMLGDEEPPKDSEGNVPSKDGKSAGEGPGKGDGSKGPPKDGCCAWGDRTHCAKPWEGCSTGLQGECCSGATKFSLEVCEKCKGEWITLPQSTCDKGHSWEKPLPRIWEYQGSGKKHTQVRVLSYNLFWWKLFDKDGGNGGSAGKLIKKNAKDAPFDFMGFQECTQPYRVLYDAGMDKDFVAWHTNQNICIAYRKSVWKMLEKGERIVANDQPKPGQNFGQRTGMWMRLRHQKTNETVFFMNHHGPLPVSESGGCTGSATAYNIMRVISEHAQATDGIILVGDFNAESWSSRIQALDKFMHRIYTGVSMGGVDHIFSNCGESATLRKDNLGSGGSDHDALSAVIRIPAH
mmetsp:Transcript_128198/g.356743  ORF Transcript_128198/g.356743 Transcript_128198/m.356743 type:complete len:427 (-) Transcript_128198:48-1328(-)